MFQRALSKIEDCHIILDKLIQADDALSFRALFNSFLTSARAVTFALQKEGKHISGFNDWYALKQQEMRDDELLRFVHEARNEDFHEGKHRLTFSTYIDHFSVKQAGSPPSPNAKLVAGAEGLFWIVDEGTPRERRIPIKRGGRFVIMASIAKAPTMHRGKPLQANDPVTICKITLDYLSELVHEAISRFGTSSPPVSAT